MGSMDSLTWVTSIGYGSKVEVINLQKSYRMTQIIWINSNIWTDPKCFYIKIIIIRVFYYELLLKRIFGQAFLCIFFEQKKVKFYFLIELDH